MGAPIPVKVQRLPECLDLPLPAYATAGSSGLDLVAAVTAPITLAPGDRKLVPTGLRIEIPSGYEGQIRARSGLAMRAGLGMVNAPGTIDSDYRGEVGIILVNWGSEPHTVRRGDRIAQLVIAPVARAILVEARALADTDRAGGGFGHTDGNPSPAGE